MPELNEGRYTGEFISSELPGALSRDAVLVTVKAATVLEPGTVLGQIAGTGMYVPYDESNSDGSEVAAGILIDRVENPATEGESNWSGVVLNFGAEVRKDDLVWGEGVDEAGGLADLAALHIKARD
jgi:hypothetical protein